MGGIKIRPYKERKTGKKMLMEFEFGWYFSRLRPGIEISR